MTDHTAGTPEYTGTVHEYDGILEHDNRLPRWWLLTLFGAMVFAGVYWMYFHTLDIGTGLRATYEADWKEVDDARKAKEASMPTSDAALLSRAQDAAAVARGKEVFTTVCAACHGQQGEGLVGPNLTDNAWIHGGAPSKIYTSVAEGVLAKAMPAWKEQLGPEKTRDVVAFVLTLKGKNLAGPRPAEGAPE